MALSLTQLLPFSIRFNFTTLNIPNADIYQCIPSEILSASQIFLFSEEQATHPPSTRELLTVLLTLQNNTQRFAGSHILFLTDSTAVVSCINTFSSHSPDLHALSSDIWLLATQYNIELSARHIPGSTNPADVPSRIAEPGDWALNPLLFQEIENRFGPHTIDRCADNLNTKLPRFNSWYLCPGAENINCLHQNWRTQPIYLQRENNYAFPPFSILTNIIDLIHAQRATTTLVVPN